MSGGRTPRALSIAGSDSGGGAGIQADLKAFARCGVHGMSALTAVTAQSTTGVSAVFALPGELVLAQVRAVLADIGVDAVKVGMLANGDVARAVARALEELPPRVPVVVDPVMVAESGAPLLDADAQEVLVREILPRAGVLTPNLPEARVLAGEAPELAPAAARERAAEAPDGAEEREARALVRAIARMGPRAVVLTGGHRERAVDLFAQADGGAVVEIAGTRHADGAAHGSGCTHSSVLAACLALGMAPLAAARRARELAGEAVANGLRDIGAGAGPVDVIGLERMRGRQSGRLP